MNKIENSLVEGLERLGLIASRIRKNVGSVPQIEIDIILEELRNLYMVALQMEKESPQKPILDVLEFDLTAAREKAEADQLQAQEAAKKAAEERRMAEEAAAKKAAEEKRLAEEAAAKKAAEEKRLAEEAAAKKAAEEAAAKKAAEEKRLAEEAAAKKAAEEKRLAEEAAAKRAAEEKRQAEEAAAKKAAEEKRQAEEAARRAEEEKRKAAAAIAAAELKAVFAPEEPAKTTPPIMEPQMEKLAGNPNDELFADEPVSNKKEKKKEASLFDYISKEQGGRPKRTLADTLNHPAHNIEEQLAGSVRAKKVDDLRTIININDKFSFMSELFHNNMKAYNDFILRLNATADRAEAMEYVKAVAEEYRWDDGSVVVKSFYKIFDRKF